MQFVINIKKQHLYGFLVGLIIILGAFMVTAFGGNNPAVLGHSAGELIVNSTSIVDGSIVDADVSAAAAIAGSKISAASLSGTAAGLSIGGSAGSTNDCGPGGTCQIAGGDLKLIATGGRPYEIRQAGTGGEQIIFHDAFTGTDVLTMDVNLPGVGSTGIQIGGGGGGSVVRCTSAGTLPTGALTVNAADCGSSAQAGLRIT